MIHIKQLDHLVLTVENIDKTIEFYTHILGMKEITFADDRKALKFGQQKINLHQKDNTFNPKAHKPTCGSADLCFISTTPVSEIIELLARQHVSIEEGIVDRTGAMGKIHSIYIRDPDNNLIEMSNYCSESSL